MPFSSQTFSAGEVLAAAKLNQVSTNIDVVRTGEKGPNAPSDIVLGGKWLKDNTALWIDQVRTTDKWAPRGIVDATAGVYFSDIIGTVGGTANAVTLTTPLNLTPTTILDGMKFCLKPADYNTAPLTLAVDTVGAKPFRGPDGRDFNYAQIKITSWIEFIYDGTLDQFVCLSGYQPIPPGTIANYHAVLVTTGGWLPVGAQTIGQSTGNHQGNELEPLFELIKTVAPNAGTEVWGTDTVLLGDARGRAIFGRDNMGAGDADRLNPTNSGIDGDVVGSSGGSPQTVRANDFHRHGQTVTDLNILGVDYFASGLVGGFDELTANGVIDLNGQSQGTAGSDISISPAIIYDSMVKI